MQGYTVQIPEVYVVNVAGDDMLSVLHGLSN